MRLRCAGENVPQGDQVVGEINVLGEGLERAEKTAADGRAAVEAAPPQPLRLPVCVPISV